MKLAQALGIRDKQVVAFVGGGGKTTAMFRLADELVTQGKCVVTTTTTRIFASQIQLAPKHWRLERGDWRLQMQQLRAALHNSRHLLIVGATTEDGKAFGVAPEMIDALVALEDEMDVVLVEADGSRMRPFKAPAEHEPVIPHSTTLLVPVVGIDTVGKTLTDAHVHRAERVAQILNVPLGTILENEHIARVIANVNGGLKNKPASARVVPLINKVENAEQRRAAREIAVELLRNDSIDAVAIGAVKDSALPITALQSRVSAVILAAGGSTRMRGQIKQLLPWGDTTFVGNAVRVAQASQVNEIVVVTGNRAQEVKTAIEQWGEIRVIHNPAWETGRASSVRSGIGALAANSSAAIFINADQPFLSPRVLDAILETFSATRAPIVVPVYEGGTGSPVLFARELFDELNALQGEQGGRDLLERYRAHLARVEIADARAGLDLDTPEEYAAAQRIRGDD